MTELSTLVCHRIADSGEPEVASRVATCDRCKAAVWRADSSPKNVDRIICGRCLEADIKEYAADGEDIKVGLPSEAQIKEAAEVVGASIEDMKEHAKLFAAKIEKIRRR